MVCARSLWRGGSLGRHSSSSVFAQPFPRSRDPQLQPRPRSPANCSLHPREEAVARKEDPGKLAEGMEGGGRWLCLPRRRERWHPGLPATRSPSLQLPLPTQQPPVQAEVAACRLTPRSAFQTKQQQETSMKFKRETAVTPAQRVHACLPPPHLDTPFLPGRKKQGATSCKAAPRQTPSVPKSAGAAELGACRRSCSGPVSPVRGRRVLGIRGLPNGDAQERRGRATGRGDEEGGEG